MNEFAGYDVLSFGEADRDSLLASGLSFASYAPPATRHHEDVDPRGKLHVENQGRLSSCVGHGVSTACETVGCFQRGSFDGVPQLSRWFAYRMGQKVWGQEGRDQGCTIQAGVDSAKKYGVCREEVCPYPSAFNFNPIPKTAIDDAAHFKIQHHVPLQDDCQQWVNFLDGGFGAIVIGVLWTSRMGQSR